MIEPYSAFSGAVGIGSSLLGYVLVSLLSMNAVASLGQSILQFRAMRPASTAPQKVEERPTFSAERTFVSVHVPTHEEPPQLVIATLERLVQLRGPDFEVLVIDNNTLDPGQWQPVAAAVARLGLRFRFYHFDDVVGAKAGALNLALELVDPRTTHVAIVDADYHVSPDFLDDAVRAITAQPVDYVQFPQAYRGVSSSASGIERELGDYFGCFGASAGRFGSLLPTGTLSVFSLVALREVGGWSSATITEDADIGVRLHAAGRRGLWLPREAGTGLLPLDFGGLQKQRARWVAGNVQVLRGIWRRGRFRDIDDEQLLVIVQLTAWVSLWLFPAVALALVAMMPSLVAAHAIVVIAAGTIIGSAILTAARMFVAMPSGDRDWRVWHAAMLTKLALTWTAATAWLPVLMGRELPFCRTLKQIESAGGIRLGPAFAASLLFLGVGLVYLTRGNVIAFLACGLLAAIWPSSLTVDARLRASAIRNSELA